MLPPHVRRVTRHAPKQAFSVKSRDDPAGLSAPKLPEGF
jgi:hypothetical protein